MRIRLVVSSLFLVSLTLPLSSCCTHVRCIKRGAAWIWPIERGEIITAEEEAARNAAAQAQMAEQTEPAPEEPAPETEETTPAGPEAMIEEPASPTENPAMQTAFTLAQKSHTPAPAQDKPQGLLKSRSFIEQIAKPADQAPARPPAETFAKNAAEETFIEMSVVEPASGEIPEKQPETTTLPEVLPEISAESLLESADDAEQTLAMNIAAPAPAQKPAPDAAETAQPAEEDTGILNLCPELETLDYDTDENISFKKMIAGKNGWLFRTRYDLKQDFPFNDKSLRDFQRLNRAFNDNGTQVVIMVIPTRGIVGGDNLLPPYSKEYNRQAAKASYLEMLERMRKSGMTVADMRTVDTVKDYFLTRDNHWTAEGARYSAYQTAQAVRAMALYKTLNKTAFQTVSAPPGEEEETANDRFMDFIERECGALVPRETVPAVYSTTATAGLLSEASLFGANRAPEAVLLGTSNSTQPDPSYANFEGFLKEYLSLDIRNKAISGGSFHGSIASYVLSGEYAREKPKLIIWELSGHYGYAQKRTFREVIPALYGECADKDALAVYKTAATGDAETVTLFDDLGTHNIETPDYYLALKLDDTETRKIKILLSGMNGGKKQISFSRSTKNFPQHNGAFYTDLGQLDSTPLKSVVLKTDARLHGGISAKICRIPR